MGCCFAFTSPAVPYTIFLLSTRLEVEGARCGAKIKVLALVVFLLRISIMLRPTQEEGEFENFVTI